MKITYIQFFDFSYDDNAHNGDVTRVHQYTANVGVETDGKEFLIKLEGCDNECCASIPAYDAKFWVSKEDQAWAYVNLDAQEVMEWLESQGVENNFFWLEENADTDI